MWKLKMFYLCNWKIEWWMWKRADGQKYKVAAAQEKLSFLLQRKVMIRK